MPQDNLPASLERIMYRLAIGVLELLGQTDSSRLKVGPGKGCYEKIRLLDVHHLFKLIFFPSMQPLPLPTVPPFERNQAIIDLSMSSDSLRRYVILLSSHRFSCSQLFRESRR